MRIPSSTVWIQRNIPLHTNQKPIKTHQFTVKTPGWNQNNMPSCYSQSRGRGSGYGTVTPKVCAVILLHTRRFSFNRSSPCPYWVEFSLVWLTQLSPKLTEPQYNESPLVVHTSHPYCTIVINQFHIAKMQSLVVNRTCHTTSATNGNQFLALESWPSTPDGQEPRAKQHRNIWRLGIGSHRLGFLGILNDPRYRLGSIS